MTARSYLYVPADRVEMLDKARAGTADAMIADLEDAVVAAAKDDARRILGDWARCSRPDHRLWVRVNADPALMGADIAAVAAAGVTQICVPKSTPASVGAAADALEAAGVSAGRIMALVESAPGLMRVHETAALPGVTRLAIGEVDLGADLGIDATLGESVWLPIRLELVVASAAAGLTPPIGPVLTDFRNDDLLAESTAGLARIGYGARAAVHPRQVDVINRAFTPSDEEVAAARDLVARFEEARAAGSGVIVAPDGTMADEATVRHARLILDRSRQLAPPPA